MRYRNSNPFLGCLGQMCGDLGAYPAAFLHEHANCEGEIPDGGVLDIYCKDTYKEWVQTGVTPVGTIGPRPAPDHKDRPCNLKMD